MARHVEPEYLLVGRVRRAHGVRGEVAVEALTEVAARFAPGAELVLCQSGVRRPVEVADARPHRNLMLVRFDGVTDRDAAELLRGATLEVEVSHAPETEPGSFYHHELIGCRCVDRVGGELGEVVEVIEDGGGVLLEVTDGQRTLLVPFVSSYIVEIEPRRSIELDLPEGLIEACGSSS